jgi:hypothetical protein
MRSLLTYLIKRLAYPLLIRERLSPAVQLQIRLLQAAFRTGDYANPEETACNVFTYHGEDGLLLYLITQLPDIPRTFADIGAGDCVKSNCALPAIHLGWLGVFIDADRRNITIGRSFYHRIDLTKFAPPRFVCARVTPVNVNALLGDNGAHEEIGLLSIDIDGDDYWIWESIEAIQPWIVIIEARIEFGAQVLVTHPGAGASKAGVVPPHAAADAAAVPHPGASVLALCRLAAQKGYMLASYNRHGYNLIFVRKDKVPAAARIRSLDPGILLSDPAISQCFFPPEYYAGKRFVRFD